MSFIFPFRTFRETFFSNTRKLLFVIALISLSISVASYFYLPLVEYIGNSGLFDKPERDVPITFLGIFIFSLALLYLQSGENNAPNNLYSKDDIQELARHIRKMDAKINEFESKNTFTDEEKNELKKDILNKTTENTLKTIFDERVEKLEDRLFESLGLESLKESFYIAIKRISEEIRKLNLRANLSLAIGMIISLGGIYILAQSIEIFNSNDFLTYYDESGKLLKKELDEIFVQMLPRLSFVFIIELFAYFFLRLYKTGLDEIKYFQNELTNIESKLVAVEVSYITKNEESMKNAIDTLVQTERNFILKKGETTVELEKAKSESEMTQNILKAIPTFLKKKG